MRILCICSWLLSIFLVCITVTLSVVGLPGVFVHPHTSSYCLSTCLSVTLILTCTGVSAHAHKNWGSEYEGQAIFARSLALLFMVLSIVMVIYAANNFRRRGDMLQYALNALSCFRPCEWFFGRLRADRLSRNKLNTTYFT